MLGLPTQNPSALVYAHQMKMHVFIFIFSSKSTLSGYEKMLWKGHTVYDMYVYFLDFIFMVALAQRMQQIGFIIMGGGGRGVGGRLIEFLKS